MANKPDPSRIPSAVGSIPVVGDVVKQAEAQAHWVQEMVEQNTRLIGQFPATLRSFNDALERFNDTVGRLDRAVTNLETATRRLTTPVDRLTSVLDPRTLRELPDALEALSKEALPALRAATDTQRQVTLIQQTLDRVVAMVGELPGVALMRRMAAPRTGQDETPDPSSPRPSDRSARGSGAAANRARRRAPRKPPS